MCELRISVAIFWTWQVPHVSMTVSFASWCFGETSSMILWQFVQATLPRLVRAPGPEDAVALGVAGQTDGVALVDRRLVQLGEGDQPADALAATGRCVGLTGPVAVLAGQAPPCCSGAAAGRAAPSSSSRTCGIAPRGSPCTSPSRHSRPAARPASRQGLSRPSGPEPTTAIRERSRRCRTRRPRSHAEDRREPAGHGKPPLSRLAL